MRMRRAAVEMRPRARLALHREPCRLVRRDHVVVDVQHHDCNSVASASGTARRVGRVGRIVPVGSMALPASSRSDAAPLAVDAICPVRSSLFQAPVVQRRIRRLNRGRPLLGLALATVTDLTVLTPAVLP